MLVLDAANLSDESIVGDECHIVSTQRIGPRYDSSFPKNNVDLCDNLILLCRLHHKQVDDQHATYTVESLHQIKADHENWVLERLKGHLLEYSSD